MSKERFRETATVYLKGGGHFSFTAYEIIVAHRGQGGIRSIKWEGKAKPEPLWVGLKDVSAVVVGAEE